MTEPAATRTLIVERELPHPPEKIWRALTEGPLIAQWLLPNDFELEAGRRFQLRAVPRPNWNGVIDCQILAFEPNARLSYSWGSLGLDSAVTFILTPIEGGTRLRMEHTGFRPDQEANYKGARYGWQKFLGNLEHVVERLDQL